MGTGRVPQAGELTTELARRWSTPREQVGGADGLAGIGTGAATAISSSLAAAHGHISPAATTHGYTEAFTVAAALAPVALIVSRWPADKPCCAVSTSRPSARPPTSSWLPWLPTVHGPPLTDRPTEAPVGLSGGREARMSRLRALDGTVRTLPAR